MNTSISQHDADASAAVTQTLADLLRHHSLAEVLIQIETSIRAKPADADLRWTLFQILCLLGDWQRALKQLQACSKMQADMAPTAHAMRDLIRAELMRSAVFSGKTTPGSMVASVPAWMNGLFDALRFAANGDHAMADNAREATLALAPEVSGSGGNGKFNWITDSDTRIGPAVELIVAGMLRWCPFSELAGVKIQAPVTVLDLIWARADFSLRDGTQLKGYLPVRYPGSENASDEYRLSRASSWREEGRTGIFGLGQKTWVTDSGDLALLDVRDVVFDTATAHDNGGEQTCSA